MLLGCSGGGPEYSVAVCLEDHDKQHVMEKDFVDTFERIGFEVTSEKYGVGNLAKKFWGPMIGVSFDAGGTWEPERPMLIVSWLDTNGNQDSIGDFEAFFIEKWGGFPISPEGYNRDLCDRMAKEAVLVE